jgi:transcriptional regulator with XRE-family HTH domain
MDETTHISNMTLKDAGNAAYRRRKELKLSQHQVGELAGVDQAEISKFERGKRVTLDTINKISKALNLPFDISFPFDYDNDNMK